MAVRACQAYKKYDIRHERENQLKPINKKSRDDKKKRREKSR